MEQSNQLDKTEGKHAQKKPQQSLMHSASQPQFFHLFLTDNRLRDTISPVTA